MYDNSIVRELEMAKQELVFNGKEVDSEVSGKLKKNTLNNGGTYYISLDNKQLDVATVVQKMCEKTGDNPLSVMKTLGDYQSTVIEYLAKGYAIKVLDLVTVQPTVRGAVENIAEAESKTEVTAKVSALPLLNESVKNLTISKVDMLIVEANIEAIKPHGYTSDTILIGKSIDVSGDKIKISGESDGVYYAKANDDGSIASREDWVKVDASEIYHSTKTELTVLVPRTLEGGKYVLIIESKYLGGGKERKRALLAISAPFTVAAE